MDDSGQHPPEPTAKNAATKVDTHSSNKKIVVQFWSQFRKLCNAFQNRIDSLLLLPYHGALASPETPLRDWNDDLKNKVRAYYATASKRNEAGIELDEILREVRLLQHRVLSSTSSMLVDGSGSTNEALNDLLSQPMPDLALTDLRLITVDIENILKRLDAAREVICPKEKFVFKRYRKALEEMNKNGCGDLVNVLDAIKLDRDRDEHQEPKDKEKDQALESNSGGVVDNKSDCFVEIKSDGSVLCNKDVNQHTDWAAYADPRSEKENSAVSSAMSIYLIQNMKYSTIIIHPTLQSLHIQNIHNCKIHSSVHGPLHVTNCHNSEIRCSAYQIRVHDSKSVRFGVWVRSGPIIEDCTSMVFAGDFYSSGVEVGKNMFWDVKDFNWLRSLRKSPNFTVIGENDDVVVDSEKTGEEMESGMNKSETKDKDSEDEL